MPRLWLISGLIYIVIALIIYLDQSLRLTGMWQWDQVLHHEAFVMATVWVGAAYFTVALVESTSKRKKLSNPKGGKK